MEYSNRMKFLSRFVDGLLGSRLWNSVVSARWSILPKLRYSDHGTRTEMSSNTGFKFRLGYNILGNWQPKLCRLCKNTTHRQTMIDVLNVAWFVFRLTSSGIDSRTFYRLYKTLIRIVVPYRTFDEIPVATNNTRRNRKNTLDTTFNLSGKMFLSEGT